MNPSGTKAFAGNVDKNLMIYQQIRRGRSNIKIFNLRRKVRRNPPAQVNSKKWEWRPSLSERRILFGRVNKQRGPDIDKIMLFDSVSQRMTRLARRKEPKEAVPGQVNGDWVTYYVCQDTFDCRGFRFNALTQSLERFPLGTGPVYGTSILENGTAYFVRSAPRCGVDVRLVERTLEGDEREIFTLDRGWDIGDTHAFVGPDGNPTVYFDLTNCRLTVQDVYGVDIPSAAPAPQPTPTASPSASPS